VVGIMINAGFTDFLSLCVLAVLAILLIAAAVIDVRTFTMVLMSIGGGVLTLGLLIAHRLRGKAGKPQIPYGVAIAFGGLVILAQRFLNQFA
jgi:prepilin peptidase CpaA